MTGDRIGVDVYFRMQQLAKEGRRECDYLV